MTRRLDGKVLPTPSRWAAAARPARKEPRADPGARWQPPDRSNERRSAGALARCQHRGTRQFGRRPPLADPPPPQRRNPLSVVPWDFAGGLGFRGRREYHLHARPMGGWWCAGPAVARGKLNTCNQQHKNEMVQQTTIKLRHHHVSMRLTSPSCIVRCDKIGACLSSYHVR